MSLTEITVYPVDQLELESNSLVLSQSSLKLQHIANSSSVRKPPFPFLKTPTACKESTFSKKGWWHPRSESFVRELPFINFSPYSLYLSLGSPEGDSETGIHRTPVLRSAPGNLKGNGLSRTEKGKKSSGSVILANSKGHLWNGSDPSQFCPHDSRQEH